MKKYLPPLVLFAGVFLSSLLFMRYTLQFQECDGFFAWTPDYFRSVFSHPFPLSRVLTDFQTQFYRLSLFAPFILALETVGVYFLLKGILSRLGWQSPLLCMAGAVAVWYASALSPTTLPLVAALLCLFPLWIVALFFRRREASLAIPRDFQLSMVLVAVAVGAVALTPSVRHTEKWDRVKNALVYQKWDALVSKTSPRAVEKDHELMPFVALALGESGELGDQLFTYPVIGENDLDMCDENDYYNSLFYRFLLYQHLNCPNEAIHNLFQLTVLQEHGTSFLVLRQLVQEYYKMGDYSMVDKYCQILDRSSLHGKFTRYFRQLVSEGEAAPETDTATRSTMPVMSRNPLQNLFLLQSQGLQAPTFLDRLLCTLLLQRKLELFAQTLEANADRYQTIPKHYQEALAVYFQEFGIPVFMYPVLPDPPVLGRFNRFYGALSIEGNREQQQAEFGNTYWFYYYYLE